MWVAAGLVAGIVALAVVSWADLPARRRVPLKAFLSTAVVLLMATSVAFLGNAVRSLQEADVIALHRWPDWPRAPIFLSQSLGYWPSRETITAQLALITVYVLGALYMFVLRPRLRRAAPAPAAAPAVDAEPPLVDAHPEPCRFGSASTSAGRSRKPSRSTSRRARSSPSAIVPTTHEHADGVAAGVVDVVDQLAAEVGAATASSSSPTRRPKR